ncbi:MAG TPA: gfo/Idh/MocA family oxidoreductase, partial [Puia sp.]|nr:gfo/Idh/MocA family oxidoreductase [Puia sp.]
VVPDSAAPPGVDFSMWLGPAPSRPFNPSRFHFNFRWFWDYAGGLMTDWGVHLLDYGLMGMKAGVPNTISALGGKFAYPDLAEETPDTLVTLYQFDEFNMVWDHALGINNGPYGRDHGIAFIGNNATLVLNRNGWEVIEERQGKNKVAKPFAPVTDDGVAKHWVNFIDAVRSRKSEALHCPIDDAAMVATVAQMGNISYRSGERLNWDKAAGKFTDDNINRDYFMKEYHNGYQAPAI